MKEFDQLEYAGFWARTLATLVDTILIFVVTTPFLLAVYGTNYFRSTAVIEGPLDFLISWVFPSVATIAFWFYHDATPGKMAIKAKILDAQTGNSPSFGQLIGRYLAYIISAIPFMLGFIWIAYDPKKQGWHDKLARTVVVKEKRISPEQVKFDDCK